MAAITWMVLTIPIATQGGLGKHIWDITYVEYFWYFKVTPRLFIDRNDKNGL